MQVAREVTHAPHLLDAHCELDADEELGPVGRQLPLSGLQDLRKALPHHSDDEVHEQDRLDVHKQQEHYLIHESVVHGGKGVQGDVPEEHSINVQYRVPKLHENIAPCWFMLFAGELIVDKNTCEMSSTHESSDLRTVGKTAATSSILTILEQAHPLPTKLKLAPTHRKTCKYMRYLMSFAMLRYIRTMSPNLASAARRNQTH